MATEITTVDEPDEAYLIFKSKGRGGIPDLLPGSRFRISSSLQPEQSIDVEVATPTELVVLTRDHPEIFRSYYPNYSEIHNWSLQRFQIRTNTDSNEIDERPLTASVLIGAIVPVISALTNIQRMLFGNEAVVRSITQNSPVNITLEGAGGLYEKLATDIIPWRRERAKQIAGLEAAQSRAQLDQKRAEVLAAEANTERERAESAAALERARQARAEANLKEVELTKARFELALNMVNQMFPGPMNAEKMQMISQLMPELVLLTGSVEVVTDTKQDSLFGP